MKDIYDTLELNTIKENIAVYCHSELAKRKLANLQPYTDLEDLQCDQEYIRQALKLIYAFGRLPLGPFDDIQPLLDKTNKDGVLFPEEFLKIIQLLSNINEINHYIEINDVTPSTLLELINQLYLPQDLYHDIHHCIDPTGYIHDHASHELQRIRRQIIAVEAHIRKKIEHLKTEHKDHLSHDVISSRNEHLVLPVKAGYKNQVHGIVHGHSSTGRTMFIEPEEIVVLNNQLANARQDEQIEIHRILLELSKKVKSYYDVLKQDLDILVDIDYIFGVSQYAKKLDMTLPEVCQDYSQLVFKQARHPLIDQKQVVANDIVLDTSCDTLLISGSNTGGKTVVLKTAGLLSLMAICALPVPAREATIPLFDEIYVDLGDGQSIEQSLSTFSSHMKKMVTICHHVSSHSLVLLDEIGSGTDPKEGESLAQAILKYLHQQGCKTIASTHYSSLKQYAKESDYIKVASVEFNQDLMKPTYRLIEGSVGNSYAIEISSRLGLKPEIIEEAYTIKKNAATVSEKLLEQLQDELAAVQQQKDKLEALNQEANYKIEHYHRMIDQFNQQKEKMVIEAKEEANLIIEDAKKQVQEIIRQLQNQPAMKPHQAIEAKRQLDLSKYDMPKVENHDHHHYQVGDVVRVLSVNREGEVVDINKKGMLTISMGGLKLNAKPTEVQFVHEKVKTKKVASNIKSLRKTTKQSYELNIIGKRYEEAMILVDKFLDDALVQHYSMVRIVHGMGTGVLRKGVRKLLDKNKYVVSYRDGGPNEGGLGATLVYFE